MAHSTKIADDIFMVPWGEGNGVIRREIWTGDDGKASRYHLAYVNQDMCPGENGQALSLEYADGVVTELRMGASSAIPFTSLADLEELFDEKWNALPRPNTPPTGHGDAQTPAADEAEYTETKGMKLTITKGLSADFFKRGKKLAGQLDRGEAVEPEKIIMLGHRIDLCYSQLPKGEWANLRGKLMAGESTAFEFKD